MTLEKNVRNAKQEAIWKAIRALRNFTVNGLICHIASEGARVNDYTVKSYVARLLKAEYLTRKAIGEKVGVGQEYQYTLSRNTGVDTPKIRKNGEPIEQGISYEHLWMGVKVLREFSPRELAISSSTAKCRISDAVARKYCFALEQAGYLTATQSGSKTGKRSATTRYRFIPTRNTGPKPPQLQYIKQVFDPNLQKVMWVQDGGAE